MNMVSKVVFWLQILLMIQVRAIRRNQIVPSAKDPNMIDNHNKYKIVPLKSKNIFQIMKEDKNNKYASPQLIGAPSTMHHRLETVPEHFKDYMTDEDYQNVQYSPVNSPKKENTLMNFLNDRPTAFSNFNKVTSPRFRSIPNRSSYSADIPTRPQVVEFSPVDAPLYSPPLPRSGFKPQSNGFPRNPNLKQKPKKFSSGSKNSFLPGNNRSIKNTNEKASSFKKEISGINKNSLTNKGSFFSSSPKSQKPKTSFQNFNSKIDVSNIQSKRDSQPSAFTISQNSHSSNRFSSGNSRRMSYGNQQSAQGGMPYDFEYSVYDAETGNDYSHRQRSDGGVTEGQYEVLLPDGRRQIVKFRADAESGYQAEVTYEGEANQNLNRQPPRRPKGNFGGTGGVRSSYQSPQNNQAW